MQKFMKTHRSYTSHKIIAISLVIAGLLTGCGEDEALDSYKESMESFYLQISAIDAGINSIDPASDTDGTQLLGYLDELDSVVAQMAEIEVPEQFASVESLADEASENMSQAVGLYHQLYSSPDYNEDVASGAYEYYERANLRIRYITDILHGEIPEELQVYEEKEE